MTNSAAQEEKFSMLASAEDARKEQASAFGLPENTSWDQILLHVENQYAAGLPHQYTIEPGEWRRDVVSRHGNVFSSHTIPFLELA